MTSIVRPNSVNLPMVGQRSRSWLLVVLLPMAGLFTRLYAEESAVDAQELIQRINREIANSWHEAGVSPAKKATDLEWLRRVCLDVLGRIPTLEEVQYFVSDRSQDRRQRWVDRMLGSAAYTEAFSRNWATIWTNLLIGRTGGSEPASLVDRDGLYGYLHQCFVENRPYDLMVRELVTAKGTTRPGGPEFNGATNFLVKHLSGKAEQATAKTAQLFLGTQIQCTQCHDHPFNDWKQQRFWELNAYFRQAVAMRRFAPSGMIRDVELTDQDFAGEGNNPEEAETYFEQRDGVLRVAYPAFLDGTPLESRSGFLDDEDRRRALARAIQGSPLLERALVNRMWRHFLGQGFTDPVDDLGPHRSISHPELLDFLATAFRKVGFDQKQLIRWLVLSEPYQLSSHGDASRSADNPEDGDAPLFSYFYVRPMSPEQLYDSLRVATGATSPGNGDGDELALRARWLRSFTSALEDDEQGEATTWNGTIPQQLMMFHGELIRRAVDLGGDNVLSRVVRSRTRPERQLEDLYLTALTRSPTGKERRLVASMLAENLVKSPAAGPDPRAAAYQDLWWAILNSNEFILNH
ncbi:MAG TPA: DUF1549 domain-containing protein [Pirellulaceae bacterium]